MKKLLISWKFFWVFFLYHGASGTTLINHACEKALVQVSQPAVKAALNKVEINLLSAEINSVKSCEYPIYVSEINSGLIYYTEFRNATNTASSKEFFFSRYDSITATWEKPINLDKEYSKFCKENKTMNFEEIFLSIDNDIYKVDFKNAVFMPEKLNINTKYIETSPALSPDGGTLYFVSDRKNGYGGKDVWASERLSNGNWSEPYNLGKTINTADDEESPYLSADGATLYFSSKGHNSYGGYDIFTTTQDYDGLWSAPENLGAPVNSVSNDFYYITDSNGSMAYYSSDKMDKGNQDIYIVKKYSTDK